MPGPYPEQHRLYAATLLSNIQEDSFYPNYIFEVVFTLATRYGFQAFNPNPLLAVQQRDASQQAHKASNPPLSASWEQQQQQHHLMALQAALQESNTRRDDPDWGRVSWAGPDGPSTSLDRPDGHTGSGSPTSRWQSLWASYGSAAALQGGKPDSNRIPLGGANPAGKTLGGGADGALGGGLEAMYGGTLADGMFGGVPGVRGEDAIQAGAGFGGAVPLVDPPYCASTLFIVVDHMCRVIVDDLMVRDCCINGVDMDTAFGEAVWIMHSKLLAAFTKWAEDNVDVPIRPRVDEELLSRKGHKDDEVLRMLVAEIALFLLIYTEAANVRHLTDGLSFLFWLARFSHDFTDALGCCPLIHNADTCDVPYSLRDAVLVFRNECASQLDMAAHDLSEGVASPEGSEANRLAQECFYRFQTQLHGPNRISPLKMLMHNVDNWREKGAFDEYLVSWMFAISEERPFLEEVVQPMFHFMAYLEDKLGRTGWETSTRLCYEDFNDSLAHPKIVRNTFALLGVSDPQEYNQAYNTLCSIGRREEGGVDLDRVAVWWEACVVRKTFLEHRGFIRVFRDYFYGHLIPVMMLNVLLAFYFTAGSLKPYNICTITNGPGVDPASRRTNCFNLIPVAWSTLVLTHAVLLALRDFCSVCLSRPSRRAPSFASFVNMDPTEVSLLPESIVVAPSAPAEPHPPSDPTKLSASPFGVTVQRIGTFPLLAVPSLLRTLVVVLVFFGQFHPGAPGRLLHSAWWPLVAVYMAMTLLLHLAGTMDGYVEYWGRWRALGALLYFFEPVNTRPGDPDPSVLGVGRKSHLRTVLLWGMALPASLFISYLGSYSLLHQLQIVLLDYNVAELGTWKLGAYDTGLPAPNILTLVAMFMLFCTMATCFGLVSFTVLMFGTQVMALLFARRHGFGHYKNWAALCQQFDRAAALWCRKCMHRTEVAKGRSSKDADGDDEDNDKDIQASQREHNTFSLVWNSIVEDFYHRDQLSLSESEALSYLRIAPDQDTLVDMQFPTVWPPAFVQGPRLDKDLRQAQARLDRDTGSALPRAMLDTLKLLLWVLHSGGALDAPELTLLVQPLVTRVGSDVMQKHFEAAQDLIREGLAFLSDLCRGNLGQSDLQQALQDYLGASHPELELEVEFSFTAGGGGHEHQGAGHSPASSGAALSSLAQTMIAGMERKPDLAAAVRYLCQLSEMHEWQDSQPEIEEVEVHLRTFIKLLHHHKLGHKGVCPAVCMSPYTTLVPVYKEGILPCIDEEAATKLMGFKFMGQQMPETLDTAKIWLGMLAEIEPGVSQLNYIQRLHPLEWRNFQCRIAAQTGLPHREVQAECFLPGNMLHEYEWELMTWCAGRTQLLGRQLPALATYYKATAMLMALECPCPHDWGVEEYYDWLKHSTGTKYQAVLSLQIMGQKLLEPKNARDVWDGKAIIAMLNHYPFLRGVYIHDEPLPGGDSVQYSVMVQGKYKDTVQEGLVQPRGAAISLATYPTPSLLNTHHWRSDPLSGYRPFSIVDQHTTALQPVYAMRLPRNYYSERGIIIGSGKSENHNLGMPFVFTDLLQGNDSNMDNLMADALKMRNVVSEHMVADRFACMFIPLLKSQVPPVPPEEQGPGMVYHVQYQTSKGLGHEHNQEGTPPSGRGTFMRFFGTPPNSNPSSPTRGGGTPPHPGFGSSNSPTWRAGSGSPRSKPYKTPQNPQNKRPVQPRGLADEWEAGEEVQVRRVVGVSKGTGKSASVTKYVSKKVHPTGWHQGSSEGSTFRGRSTAGSGFRGRGMYTAGSEGSNTSTPMSATSSSSHGSVSERRVRPRSRHPRHGFAPPPGLPKPPMGPHSHSHHQPSSNQHVVPIMAGAIPVNTVQSTAPHGPWSVAQSSSHGEDGNDSVQSFVLKVSHHLQQRGGPDTTTSSTSSSLGVAFTDVCSAMKSVAQSAQLAVLGINPWVCTHTQGNFAWLNALNECFFTFNIQSQLNYASRIRYHYGLGDVWNKFWAMTNSGVSRPCTNLHAVEDLPAGVRVVLKGGIIKLRDYLLVGKCREEHLIGMLSYMYKICSGGYESALGRDYFLLHSKFDPFRQAGSWNSITGMVTIFRLWFSGVWLRMQVEMLLLLTGKRDDWNKEVPEHTAEPPDWLPLSSNLNAWDCGVLVFWTVVLPFLLYGSAIRLQHGLGRALRDMLRLHSTLWVVLNHVYSKWWDSIAHMSAHHQLAQYVATGRGFGLHHVPFIYKYCLFSHTLWYYAAVTIATGALLLCDPQYWSTKQMYGHAVTLFVILTGAMQIFGCFWYTPLSFSLGHVIRDAGDWWGWMHGQADAYSGTTYAQWQQQQLEPWHNAHGLVEAFYTSWIKGVLGTSLRNGISIFFCIRLIWLASPHTNVIISLLGIPIAKVTHLSLLDMAAALSICTATFWTCLLLVCLVCRLVSCAAQVRSSPAGTMLMTGLGLVTALVAMVACYQPFLLPIGVSVPPHLIARNLFAVMACNFLSLGWVLQVLQLVRWRPVMWLVSCMYWGIDLCYGLALQVVLVFSSLNPLVQWLQNETIHAGAGYSAAMCQTD